MRVLTLLIKPASSQCNLRCSYCFYHDVASKRSVRDFGMMSEEILDVVIKKAYEYADRAVNICFQGGEPTLRGLSFFRGVIETVKRYNVNEITTTYSIQTNGILIDDEWAKFFKAHKFLVGISVDGYKDTHDLNRLTPTGKGTHNQVQKAIRILEKQQIDFNILCVVTRQIAQHASKVYRFYKTQGWQYIQFIPCMESLDQPMGQAKYALTPALYGEFLIKLFNEWYEDVRSGAYISIRMFDNIISMLIGKPAESCDMRGACSRGTVIESDGSVYPCDFYATDEWKTGNVQQDDFESMINSEKMDRFVEQSKRIDPACQECEYYGICRGGCRRYKEPIKEGEPLSNYFCESYKMFYEASLERLHQIAQMIRE